MSVSMNALVLHGPGDIRHERVSKPEASAGSVVVRVIAAPIWDYVVCAMSILFTGERDGTRSFRLTFLIVRSPRRLAALPASLPADIRDLLRRTNR